MPILLASLDDGILTYLLNAGWQSFLLLVLVALLSLLLRRRSLRFHKTLWTVALLAAPLLPLGTNLLTTIGAPVVVLTELGTAEPEPDLPVHQPDGLDAHITPSTYHSRLVAHEPTPPRNALHEALPWPSRQWLVILLAGGSGLLLIGTLVALLRVRSWTRRALPVTDPRVLEAFEVAQSALGLKAPCFLFSGSGVLSPISVGLFNYRILLPDDLGARFNDEELHDLALHEIAHLRHADPPILAATAIARALLFFNPLMWFARHRLTLLTEHCADAAVIHTTEEAGDYAKLLVRLAERPVPIASQTTLAAGALGRRSFFLRRAERILSGADLEPENRLLDRLLLPLATLLPLLVALALPLSIAPANKAFEPAPPAANLGWEAFEFAEDPAPFIAEHLGLALPFTVENQNVWTMEGDVADVTSWLWGHDLAGKEFRCFLDRDPRRPTYGHWFLGEGRPGDPGVQHLEPRSPREHALRLLLVSWVADHYTLHQWEQMVLESRWTDVPPEHITALFIDAVLDENLRLQKNLPAMKRE